MTGALQVEKLQDFSDFSIQNEEVFEDGDIRQYRSLPTERSPNKT